MRETKTTLFFDNPLATKILKKEHVAHIFDVSVKTIERMMGDGSLPVHYVGNKPRFFLDQVLCAFIDDSLDFRRRKSYDKTNQKQKRVSPLSGTNQFTRPKSLQELRELSGSSHVD